MASNLALAFAEAGYRTLLIDADTRRGALHEVFAAQRRPGLIEVLSGEVPRAEVLHPTSQERLMLLPCGGRRTTNPELIASAALPRLLSELVREFSVIIVDGPPLSAGIDAFAIGAACENTVMILRHGKTDMRMARTKLGLLRQTAAADRGRRAERRQVDGRLQVLRLRFDIPRPSRGARGGDGRLLTVG